MSSEKFAIRHETDGDAPLLSKLAAEAFGPGRFTRSAYRVREGVPPVAGLSLCGELDGMLVGGIRFTAIRIGEREGGVLLGPLVSILPWRAGDSARRLSPKAWHERSPKASPSLSLSATCPTMAGSASSRLRPVTSRCPDLSTRRGCSPLSLSRAHLPALRGRRRVMCVSDLRGTRWQREGRAEGRAREIR